jgi:hypothetical protein
LCSSFRDLKRFELVMSKGQIQSDAFRNAQLHSERLRIFGVLGFFVLFVLVTVARIFLIRTVSGTNPWVWSFLIAAIVIGYELWTLHKVHRASKASGNLPPYFWTLSTIIEASIPAFAIAFVTNSQVEISYRSLASPSVLVFFVFIIFSTLRLSSWIGTLSGIVASVSYLCAALYLGWRPPVPGIPAPVTQSGVSLNAITLLVGGDRGWRSCARDS